MEDKVRNLITAQETYINFLHLQISNLSTTSKYQITKEYFELGEELRKDIRKIKEDLFAQ